MSKGWIKIQREIADHWLWRDEPLSKAQAWIDLIIHANYKPAEIKIKGRIISLEIGQQARSEITLSAQWKWSRNKVRRFLKLLKTEHMIFQETIQQTSIISVCNYSNYQSVAQHDDTGVKDLRDTETGHTQDIGRYTVKEVKKVKNLRHLKTSAQSNCAVGEINNQFEDLFNEFWNAGMHKIDKKRARPVFNKLLINKKFPQPFVFSLIDDIKKRIRSHQPGFEKMNPVRYLRDERWNDDPTIPKNVHAINPSPLKNLNDRSWADGYVQLEAMIEEKIIN